VVDIQEGGISSLKKKEGPLPVQVGSLPKAGTKCKKDLSLEKKTDFKGANAPRGKGGAVVAWKVTPWKGLVWVTLRKAVANENSLVGGRKRESHLSACGKRKMEQPL